ncbi:MAG: site-specific integrase [Bacteroidetes bacterium]|nr:site-specific integrase [Bacteroidota bacterium]
MAKKYHLELNHKPNIDGKYSLLLRVSENRKHKRVSLGYSIASKYWNDKNKSIRVGCPDKRKIEEKFRQLQNDMQDLDLEGLKRKKPVSIEVLKNRVIKAQYHNFYDFADSLIKRWKETKSVNHVKHIQSIIDNLKVFSGDRSLNFEDFSVELIKDLEAWYVGQKNVASTIKEKLRKLRMIFKEAEEIGIIEMQQNPFRKYKLPKGVSAPKVILEASEIRKIEKLVLPPDSLIYHVKNAFLFSFMNAGIRVGDLIQLKWENIKGDSLDYQMRKNGKRLKVRMVKEAQEILSLYYDESVSPSDYIFPFFSSKVDYSDKFFLDNQISSRTAQINENLKAIASKAKINKPLSSHIARHSFASKAIDTLPINELRGLLNHSSIKTTSTYIGEINADRASDALGRVFNKKQK